MFHYREIVVRDLKAKVVSSTIELIRELRLILSIMSSGDEPPPFMQIISKQTSIRIVATASIYGTNLVSSNPFRLESGGWHRPGRRTKGRFKTPSPLKDI